MSGERRRPRRFGPPSAARRASRGDRAGLPSELRADLRFSYNTRF